MTRLFYFLIILLLSITGCNKSETGPVITSLSSSLGQVGANVAILGHRFSTLRAEDIVTFNGIPAEVSSASEYILNVIVPAGATTGKVMVTVNGLSVAGPVFTVYTPGKLTGVSPFCGPAGTEITIEGNGFETFPGNMQVMYGYTYLIPTPPNGYTAAVDQISLTVTSLSATQIKVLMPSTIPSDAQGSLIVKAFGTQHLFVSGTNNDLRFVIAPYKFTGFTPKSGKVGTLVVFTGTDFNQDPSLYPVYFDQDVPPFTEATITSITSTTLTVRVPANTITGEISIGGRVSAGVFTVEP